MDTIRSYRCPKKYGGCGSDSSWIVALREAPVPSLVCECNNCGRRMNFPLSTNDVGQWIGPIEMTGKPIED